MLAFLKKWALLCAILFGSLMYLLFSNITPLAPWGNTIGPLLVDAMPLLIFLILYVTFCKIELSEFRPRKWHFILQGIRIILSGFCVLLNVVTDDANMKLILQGIFICIICPTASSAPVVTEKLGGNISSLTVYLLIANCVSAVIIPLFFPMMEKSAQLTFLFAFLMVLRRVVAVLVIPLCMALLTRKFLPKWQEWIRSQKNLAFYLWCVNLSIVMGLTTRNILHAPVSGHMLFLLCTIPLVLSFLQFGMGKLVGKRYGDSISAGQALGQKNTVVGIWLTLNFLNPYAAIAPCAYVIWQNLINSWQLWFKEKFGTLRW